MGLLQRRDYRGSVEIPPPFQGGGQGVDSPYTRMHFVPRKLHDIPQLKDLRRKLRSKLPPAEWLLWQELKNRGLQGYKFRR